MPPLLESPLFIVAALAVLVLAGVCMAVSPIVKDALVQCTRALPASTTAVTSTIIDTGTSARGMQPGNVEWLLEAPLVTTAQLPDTKTFIYDIIHSDNADGSSPAVLFDNVITQTGASSAGAAAATWRGRLPTNAKRYIGFTVTPSASGTGDASAATATLHGQF